MKGTVTGILCLFRQLTSSRTFFFQIVEPNMAEGGEVIANIPIKFSVNAVYSKYNISPSSIINFGALICGTRKSTTFTIENQGIIDFKYALYRMTGENPTHQKKV